MTPSLALSTDDEPWIAYYDSKRGALAVALRYTPPDAGVGVKVWGYATLDEPQVGTAGFIPVLRLSRQDEPVIAYTYSTGSANSVRVVKVRNNATSMWTVDRGSGPVGVGDALGMDLDDDDRPVVAYHDPDNKAVILAR